MAKQKDNFDYRKILSLFQGFKSTVMEKFAERKKLYIGIALITAVVIFNFALSPKKTNSSPIIKSASVKLGKSWDFTALNNAGKPLGSKVKFTLSTAEKTNQVLVNDKAFTAKNNKLFLILNLELKNDATQPVNILPGDLIRLSYDGDDDNKFAPDLHNNLVGVSAISTKLDRVGFVIPETARNFKIYIGEIEGKKESIDIGFPS